MQMGRRVGVPGPIALPLQQGTERYFMAVPRDCVAPVRSLRACLSALSASLRAVALLPGGEAPFHLPQLIARLPRSVGVVAGPLLPLLPETGNRVKLCVIGNVPVTVSRGRFLIATLHAAAALAGPPPHRAPGCAPAPWKTQARRRLGCSVSDRGRRVLPPPRPLIARVGLGCPSRSRAA